MARWVAGVDGCRKGWIAALRDLDAPDRIHCHVVPDFAALLARREAPRLIAVDMPIGLTDAVGRGGRVAEQQVRPLLGKMRGSIFPTSVRAVIEARSYADALALARETGQPFLPSPFANAIAPRIRQIDALLRDDTSLRERVYEVHPELAFWSMNGGCPLNDTKRTEPGLQHRRVLLQSHGIPEAVTRMQPPSGAKTDDLLDALAALVVAERIAEGRGRPYPDPPEIDAHGIAAAIWTFKA